MLHSDAACRPFAYRMQQHRGFPCEYTGRAVHALRQDMRQGNVIKARLSVSRCNFFLLPPLEGALTNAPTISKRYLD